MSFLLKNLKESTQVRKAIIEQSENFLIPLQYVCLKAGIHYPSFITHYLRTKEGSSFDVTEEDFLKLLELLGFDVRITIVKVADEAQMFERREELRRYFENHFLKKDDKKKRNSRAA